MEPNPKIMRYCLWLLSRRDYSISEIRKKLTEKEYSPDEIEIAVMRLADIGLLDDRRFSENYIRAHPSRGKIRIKYELLRRGINIDLLEEIAGDPNKSSQISQALEVAKTWWLRKNKPDVDKYKLKQQLMAKLSRQGFEYEVIREAIGQLLEK